MFKLRTMVINSDDVLRRHLVANAEARHEWDRYGRLAEDPRIRCLTARLARRFSIDEIPQILNVLRGEMNLVGPRPLPLDILRRMPLEDRLRRRQVLPGMTGLWQISGRSDVDIARMGAIDSEYVRNRSVARDVVILVRTVGAVVSARGAF